MAPPPAKKAKAETIFGASHMKTFPFLTTSEKGPTFAKCTVCGSDFNIASGGKNDINKHVRTEKHLNASKARKDTGGLLKFMTSKKADNNNKVEEQTTKAELLFTQFVIEHNISIATADHARSLFQEMFHDSEIAKKFSCGRTKTTSLVGYMASLETSHLIKSLQTQPFSISTDGSNDGSNNQLYPMVVRFFDKIEKRVVTQLLTVKECSGPSTGENIFRLIDGTLKKYSIPWDNVISFGCDNASVMTGKHKGVAAFIHKVNPSVIISGCICHLLHLAAKAGAKSLSCDVESALVDIYFYMDKSSKRQQQFRSFQQDCGVALKKILKHGGTRWLSLQQCVDRLIEQWTPLAAFYQAELGAIKESHRTKAVHGRLIRITNFFSSPSSKLYCLFLQDVLPTFTKANLLLQEGMPQIHRLHLKLQDVFADVYVRFIKTSAIAKSSDLYTLAHEDRANQVHRDELKIGLLTRQHLSELKSAGQLSKEAEDTFVHDVRHFLSAVVKYILGKFPLDDAVLKNACVLDVKQRGRMKLEMALFFARKFPSLIPPSQLCKLEMEFARYQIHHFDNELDNQDISKQWWEVSTVLNGDDDFKFPTLFKAMEIVLVIPHSNADSERVFSIVRKNKTEFRAGLSPTTLSNLLVKKIAMQSRGQACYHSSFTCSELQDAKKATSLSLQPQQD